MGERVSADVVANGSNVFYIVAKQKNPGSKESAYYYLEKNKDAIYRNSDQINQGPYSEADFIELSKKLSLPQITKELRH